MLHKDKNRLLTQLDQTKEKEYFFIKSLKEAYGEGQLDLLTFNFIKE